MILTKQNSRKLISVVIGIALIFALALILGTMARENVSAAVATYTDISISPASVDVVRGSSATFNVTVTEGLDFDNYEVKGWYYSGGYSADTKLYNNGNGTVTLVVGSNESQSSIDVWYILAEKSTVGTGELVATATANIKAPAAGWVAPVTPTTPPAGSTEVTETKPHSDPKKAKSSLKFEMKDNVMVITFKADDIDLSKIEENENYVITADEWGNISLAVSADVVKALDGKDLEIRTTFGAIVIPNALLGDGVTIVLKYGSFTVELYDKDGKAIADFAAPVSITLPYTLEDGQDAANVVAYKKDGAYYPIGIYNGKVIAFEAVSSGTYDIKYNKVEFDDMAEHWAKDYVNFVTARGIFAGSGDFKPEEKVTRAMFAAELAKLDGADLGKYKESSFEDIDAGAAYLGAVEWAVEAEIINGKGEGKFAPADLVTREEMAAMFTRYLEYKGIGLAAAVEAIDFVDADAISEFAADAVKVMTEAGIITGKPSDDDLKFDPKGNTTKAEVATIFDRFIKAVNK